MNGHRQHAAGPGFGQDGFDPEEIFNMFFNGGFGGNRCALTAPHALSDGAWQVCIGMGTMCFGQSCSFAGASWPVMHHCPVSDACRPQLQSSLVITCTVMLCTVVLQQAQAVCMMGHVHHVQVLIGSALTLQAHFLTAPPPPPPPTSQRLYCSWQSTLAHKLAGIICALCHLIKVVFLPADDQSCVHAFGGGNFICASSTSHQGMFVYSAEDPCSELNLAAGPGKPLQGVEVGLSSSQPTPCSSSCTSSQLSFFFYSPSGPARQIR